MCEFGIQTEYGWEDGKVVEIEKIVEKIVEVEEIVKVPVEVPDEEMSEPLADQKSYLEADFGEKLQAIWTILNAKDAQIAVMQAKIDHGEEQILALQAESGKLRMLNMELTKKL